MRARTRVRAWVRIGSRASAHPKPCPSPPGAPITGPMSAGAAALCVVLQRGEDIAEDIVRSTGSLRSTVILKATCKAVLEVCMRNTSQRFREVLAAAWRRRQVAQAKAQGAVAAQPHRCILPLVSADVWDAL